MEISSVDLASSSNNTIDKKRKDIQPPGTTTVAYIVCLEASCPNVKISLETLATLLVTTASTKRTFSLLK